MTRRTLAALLFLVTIHGCGNSGSVDSENFGNLLTSPGTCTVTNTTECRGDSDCPSGEVCDGLILVREEHPTGWSRPECFACHQIRNIHTVNRTGLSDEEADLADVRAIVRNQGQASCVLCHGTNGVTP
ncbi:MAG: hypothetical protein ACE5I7_02825 [Candidatus Binatia bacterium]